MANLTDKQKQELEDCILWNKWVLSIPKEQDDN